MEASEIIAPIQQTTLADMVYERIRQAIVVGQLHPGERLSETVLANQLGVSRSPVREALHRLESEGLVIRQTNHSCFVWNPTEKDVEELFSLRIMLESLAAECCIQKLDEGDFRALSDLIVREEQAIQSRDFLKLIREDWAFHEYLCLKTQHNRLMGIWNQVMGQWEVLIYRRLMHDPDQITISVSTNHNELLTAFRQRNLDKVNALHRSINESVIQNLKVVLSESSPV